MTDFYEAPGQIQFMRNVNGWPRWPFLPLKRYTEPGRMEVGLLFEREMGHLQPIIYLTNLMTVQLATIEKLERVEYDTFEALVDAGWMVD